MVGEVAGRGQKYKLTLLSFFPSALPPRAARMPQRCQGASFSVLFCLASSGLGSPAWPPTLLGRAREGGKAVGTEAEGEGRHLRWLAPAKWRQGRVRAKRQPWPGDSGRRMARAFWPVGSVAAPAAGAAGRGGRGAGDGPPRGSGGRLARPRPAEDRAWRDTLGSRKPERRQEGRAAWAAGSLACPRVSPTALCWS